jgi:hypothetical protein
MQVVVHPLALRRIEKHGMANISRQANDYTYNNTATGSADQQSSANKRKSIEMHLGSLGQHASMQTISQ